MWALMKSPLKMALEDYTDVTRPGEAGGRRLAHLGEDFALDTLLSPAGQRWARPQELTASR